MVAIFLFFAVASAAPKPQLLVGSYPTAYSSVYSAPVVASPYIASPYYSSVYPSYGYRSYGLGYSTYL